MLEVSGTDSQVSAAKLQRSFIANSQDPTLFCHNVFIFSIFSETLFVATQTQNKLDYTCF